MSNRPSVFVVDPYHELALAKLKQNDHAIKVILPDDPQKSEWLQEATAVLVRSETRISAEVLAQANSSLAYIIKQGVGVDNIDLAAAKARGIKVFNTPALNSEAVAELTIALAFCVSRRVCEVDRLIRNGDKVVRSKMLGKSLFRKTLGVIGMGNIGIEVARKWIPGEMYRRVQTLGELLEVSDVVSLHVPLNDSTRNLLSRKQFAMMKEGSILLNCSRGGVVDEAALLDALHTEHLFGAGLDAVKHEPPDLATYGETLLSHPRVVITPHIGASTEENQSASGCKAVEIVLDLIEGGTTAEKHRPLN